MEIEEYVAGTEESAILMNKIADRWCVSNQILRSHPIRSMSEGNNLYLQWNSGSAADIIFAKFNETGLCGFGVSYNGVFGTYKTTHVDVLITAIKHFQKASLFE